MNSLELIKKNELYYSDIEKAGDRIPFSKSMASVHAIISYIIWGTSFSEYFGYRFWTKTIKEKKTYMTRRHMFKFFDRYDPAEYRERIGDKSIAPLYYGHLMKREQATRSGGYECFCDFCNRHTKVFIKKKLGWGGEGSRVMDVRSNDEIVHAWETLTEEYVAEPLLENCEVLKTIYPESLNTIKVTVLQTKKGPLIATAIIRFGNRSVVDNVHSGGIAAGINIDTGMIVTNALDGHFQRYTHHPETKQLITGLTIPNWKEVKKLALEASMITPQIRYASWDIALTSDGPALIEGNWDAEFYMEQMLYNCGHRKLFTDMLEGVL